MLALLLTIAVVSGQVVAPEPWPFVGPSPVLRFGPPVEAPGFLARYLTPSGSTVSFSGVTFTRSSSGAACTASDGSVTFPASGVPCLAGGYHARPQIADLLTETADFTAAAWAGSCTATANTAIAPDGTTTADTVTAAVAGCNKHQQATSTGGGASVSGYARALTGTASVKVELFDVTAATTLATKTCSVTAAWPLRSDLRCSVSVASTTAGHIIQFVFVPDATGGTGSVYAWGFQAEWSAFPNDYCPSGSTPATCAAEVMTVPTPGGMSLTSGCARYCVTPNWTGGAPGVTHWLYLGNSSRLGYDNGGNTSIQAYDGTSIAVAPGSFVSGSRVCVNTRWSSAANSLRVDNLTSGTQGTAQAFSGFGSFTSTMQIGGISSGLQPFGAIIDSIVLGSSPEACR